MTTSSSQDPKHALGEALRLWIDASGSRESTKAVYQALNTMLSSLEPDSENVDCPVIERLSVSNLSVLWRNYRLNDKWQELFPSALCLDSEGAYIRFPAITYDDMASNIASEVAHTLGRLDPRGGSASSPLFTQRWKRFGLDPPKGLFMGSSSIVSRRHVGAVCVVEMAYTQSAHSAFEYAVRSAGSSRLGALVAIAIPGARKKPPRSLINDDTRALVERIYGWRKAGDPLGFVDPEHVREYLQTQTLRKYTWDDSQGLQGPVDRSLAHFDVEGRRHLAFMGPREICGYPCWAGIENFCLFYVSAAKCEQARSRNQIINVEGFQWFGQRQWEPCEVTFPKGSKIIATCRSESGESDGSWLWAEIFEDCASTALDREHLLEGPFDDLDKMKEEIRARVCELVTPSHCQDIMKGFDHSFTQDALMQMILNFTEQMPPPSSTDSDSDDSSVEDEDSS